MSPQTAASDPEGFYHQLAAKRRPKLHELHKSVSGASETLLSTFSLTSHLCSPPHMLHVQKMIMARDQIIKHWCCRGQRSFGQFFLNIYLIIGDKVMFWRSVNLLQWRMMILGGNELLVEVWALWVLLWYFFFCFLGGSDSFSRDRNILLRSGDPCLIPAIQFLFIMTNKSVPFLVSLVFSSVPKAGDTLTGDGSTVSPGDRLFTRQVARA